MSNNTLNVCVVAPLYHLTLGGLGRQAQLLTEKLADAGINIFVITRKMEGIHECSYSSKVKRIRVWTPRSSLSVLEEVNFSSILISLVFSISCAWILLRKRRDYDVVHFHGARAALYVNIPLLKLLGKKIVAKVSAANHPFEAGSLRGTYFPLGYLLAQLIKTVDIFIAISEEIHQGLLQDRVAEEKILRVPNFIDVKSFESRYAPCNALRENFGLKDRIVVTYCGRLVSRKGVDVLLMAWQSIVRAHEHAVLLILGDGPLRNELERMVHELDIEHSVVFTGWQEDITGFLSITDVFVQSSLQEGLANALLEAMALGLPIVATRIGGSEDVIQDGINGLLVEPKDSKGLASAVLTLIEDKPKASFLRRNALETIKKNYSIEEIHMVYIDLYRRLCS